MSRRRRGIKTTFAKKKIETMATSVLNTRVLDIFWLNRLKQLHDGRFFTQFTLESSGRSKFAIKTERMATGVLIARVLDFVWPILAIWDAVLTRISSRFLQDQTSNRGLRRRFKRQWERSPQAFWQEVLHITFFFNRTKPNHDARLLI